jgi:hypothetical protein
MGHNILLTVSFRGARFGCCKVDSMVSPDGRRQSWIAGKSVFLYLDEA